MAINADRAGRDIEEARQQMHERTLARSAGADNRQHFAGMNAKIDFTQHLALIAVMVAEVDVVENDLASKGGQRRARAASP